MYLLKKYGIDTFIRKNIRYYFKTQNYVFTHGIIPYDMKKNFYKDDWRKSTSKDWNRFMNISFKRFIDLDIRIPDKTLVCGHMFVKNVEKTLDSYYENGMIGLNSNCYKTNKMNVIIVED